MFKKIVICLAGSGVFCTPLEKPCTQQFESCLTEMFELGQVSDKCEPMPWCDNDGYYFQGPVCDGTCRCLDRQTGEVSISKDGFTLVTSEVLPDDVFDAENRLDCSLFSSNQDNSASLEEMLSSDVFAKIAKK